MICFTQTDEITQLIVLPPHRYLGSHPLRNNRTRRLLPLASSSPDLIIDGEQVAPGLDVTSVEADDGEKRLTLCVEGGVG